jgi:threonine/homoserine/homoserine lactone efflux protein
VLDARLLAFTGTVAVLTLTPGPDTMLAVRRAPVREKGTAAGARRAFVEGFLTNVLNPKVAVFYLAFLPQFVGPAAPVLARSHLLAAIHCALSLAWLSLVTVFVVRLRPALERPAARRILEAVSGTVFVAFGLHLALGRR